MSVLSVRKILIVGGVGTFIYFNVDYQCEEIVLPKEKFSVEEINPDDRFLAIVNGNENVTVLEKLPEVPQMMTVQDIEDFYPEPKLMSVC